MPAAALPWLVLAFFTALLLAVYGRSLEAPFIFDDIPCIVENRSIVELWPLAGEAGHAPLSPPRDFTTSGRPLVNLSLALNVFVGDYDPLGYHLVNLLLHAVNATLLWAVVRRTLRLPYFAGRFDRVADRLALLVALLFALHPLQTETVEYVSQRTELMMACCYLATLYASLRYMLSRWVGQRQLWGAVAVLACAAGMACKEVMVSAPVIVLLFVRTFVAGSFRRALRDSWPLYLGLSAGWAILAALNLGGPRSATAGFHLDLPASVWWFTQAKVFWLYMQLACWPWPLLIHYEIPYLESFRQAWPWVLGLALLALAVLVQCARRRASGFLGAWVFAILAPTLVVPIITEVAAERRMYLPLAALAALAVVGGYALAQASARRFSSGSAAATSNRPSLGLVTAAVLGLAIVYGLVSALRLEAYQDGVTLWRDDLAHRPDDPVALINLGVELLNARQPGEAIEQFQRAIDMGGRLVPKARLELGTALLRTDRMAEAIEQLRLALGDMPESAKAHGYLGHALLQEGRTAEAIEQLKLSLEYLPDSPEVEQDLGDAYLASGRLQDAVAHYQRLVPLKPDQADAHRKLGVALGRLGAIDAATEQLEEAVRLEPDSAEAHQFLAVALINQNRVPEAIRHLERAMRLGLDTADVHHYLGVALYNVNRVQDAIDQFELALQKNPDHAAARASLEQARGTRRPGAAP